MLVGAESMLDLPQLTILCQQLLIDFTQKSAVGHHREALHHIGL